MSTLYTQNNLFYQPVNGSKEKIWISFAIYCIKESSAKIRRINQKMNRVCLKVPSEQLSDLSAKILRKRTHPQMIIDKLFALSIPVIVTSFVLIFSKPRATDETPVRRKYRPVCISERVGALRGHI